MKKLMPSLDYACIADSLAVNTKRTEEKGKPVLVGQIVAEDVRHYQELHAQVQQIVSKWSQECRPGSKFAVDISGGAKTVNSCICLAATAVGAGEHRNSPSQRLAGV